MDRDHGIIDVCEVDDGGPSAGRRGDGGVYLVAADETEEFSVALRYAARRAKAHRAHVGILHVVSIDDFQHWGNIEAIMRHELREQAEKFIWDSARTVNDLDGLRPCLYLREGDRIDALVDAINEDTNIRALILGAGTAASGPGPMVSYFTGKGISRLRVPLVLVPGHLDPHKIDEIAS